MNSNGQSKAAYRIGCAATTIKTRICLYSINSQANILINLRKCMSKLDKSTMKLGKSEITQISLKLDKTDDALRAHLSFISHSFAGTLQNA